jgi:hypothetical protein
MDISTPVKEAANSQCLRRLSPYLVNTRQPGQACIKRYPKVLCSLDPLYWLSKKLDWSLSLDASHSLSEEHSGALRDVDSNPLIPKPELESVKKSL